MNFGIPYVQDGLRKGRGTKHQTANIHWIIEKARKLMKKKIYLYFIDYIKAFDYWYTTNLESSSKFGNTRSPYLPPKKSVYRSRNNS